MYKQRNDCVITHDFHYFQGAYNTSLAERGKMYNTASCWGNERGRKKSSVRAEFQSERKLRGLSMKVIQRWGQLTGSSWTFLFFAWINYQLRYLLLISLHINQTLDHPSFYVYCVSLNLVMLSAVRELGLTLLLYTLSKHAHQLHIKLCNVCHS